ELALRERAGARGLPPEPQRLLAGVEHVLGRRGLAREPAEPQAAVAVLAQDADRGLGGEPAVLAVGERVDEGRAERVAPLALERAADLDAPPRRERGAGALARRGREGLVRAPAEVHGGAAGARGDRAARDPV